MLKLIMTPEQHERYVRWQDYRITQLSFSINLFLGFAVASLAYAINLKLDNKLHGVISVETIIIWWTISAISGCFATISKLLDYRHTALKIKDGGWFNIFMVKWCGLVTWVAFWVQVLTYSIGAYQFISSIIRT
jgi:hypothetical protein